MVANDSSTLSGSIRPGSGLRYSGSRNGPAASSSSITGTPSRNTAPHQNHSSSSPPTEGPTAAPLAKHAIHTAMAKPRCRGSRNMLLSSDRLEGVKVAPATPSRARAAISIAGLVAKAAASEARPNAAAPMSSSLRRPMRSARPPMVTRNPATRKP